MVKFLLYLFETGLCLSILFLVYTLFFRKETYFKFNRLYLVSIMFLALLVPFIHINITVTDTQRYENAINEIGKFRTYYEQLIAYTDPDYMKYTIINQSSGFEEYNEFEESGNHNSKNNIGELSVEPNIINNDDKETNLTIAQVIFLVYILGVLVFTSRIFLLFHWIYKTISKNQVEIYNNVKVIKLNKNLPPFSFLGYVFINDNIANNEIEQILEHEKAHIRQFHSVDLLIAHGITIIQWFNPFVWFLHKAIKRNHEYLADSKVVNKGHNLLDYQELLLNQFISIPSVQLVNNFNLISIKNRINMMNKQKSGFIAKFKALLIIPAALFAFILFANLTLKSPSKTLRNVSLFKIQSEMSQVKGLWKNTSDNKYGFRVLIENNRFSVLDKNIMLKQYPYSLDKSFITLDLPGGGKTKVQYEIVNEQLKIWWNSEEYSMYEKLNYTNTLDEYLADIPEEINLPEIENYWLLQRLELCIDVALINDKVFVNKKPTSYNKLKEVLLKEKSKINQLDQHLATVRIYADKNLSMKYMHQLNQVLREIGLLKIAYVGKVTDQNVSKLYMGYVGMGKKLPPLKGMKLMDKKNMAKEGITLIDIDATDENVTPKTIKPDFKEKVLNSERYVANLYYDEATILNKYLGFHDMARSVIYEFRNNYALEKYGLNYDELASLQQKEIKKKYPIIISEADAFKP